MGSKLYFQGDVSSSVFPRPWPMDSRIATIVMRPRSRSFRYFPRSEDGMNGTSWCIFTAEARLEKYMFFRLWAALTSGNYCRVISSLHMQRDWSTLTFGPVMWVQQFETQKVRAEFCQLLGPRSQLRTYSPCWQNSILQISRFQEVPDFQCHRTSPLESNEFSNEVFSIVCQCLKELSLDLVLDSHEALLLSVSGARISVCFHVSITVSTVGLASLTQVTDTSSWLYTFPVWKFPRSFCKYKAWDLPLTWLGAASIECILPSDL